ncbi:MAG: right-handed parallel beta-helix repeat-containing protein [Candidatus Eisenbacteria sp.]|nr:right-handed parallel beta-helix repeat-containing protein [Candidatus Eisenbacteria bacterium]
MRPSLVFFMLYLSVAASAAPIIVDTGGSGDYLTIQEGIDAASYGDTVLVMCGTYYEHDIVMKSGIYLTSETGQPECVTVDAGSLGRALYCSGADSTTIMEGLTIANGFSPVDGGAMFCEYSSLTITNCAFTDNWARNEWGHVRGGGIAFEWSSPTITDCDFSGNAVNSGWPHGESHGGALSFYQSDSVITDGVFLGNGDRTSAGGGVYGNNSPLTLIGCTFEENVAGYGAGIYAGGPVLIDCVFSRNGHGYSHGGAAHVGHGGTITGCTFEDNVAEFGGALWCGSGSTITDCIFLRNSAHYTGAVDCFGPTTIEGCTFSGNRSDWCAGAIYMYDGGTVQQCVITDNLAVRSGGGICCGTSHEGSSTAIINCVIAENESYETGGGIACVETTAILIVGCTILGNTAWGGGGAISASGSAHPIVENSILSFSHAGGSVLCDSTSSASLTCTDVFGNEEGDWTECIADQEFLSGNFSLDPLFCDMASGDFSLCANSPCLPATRDCEELIGALGQGCGNCDSPVEGVLFVTSCDEETVTLRWTLAGLDGYAGINIYRATDESGDFIKLNDVLLPASLPGIYIDATVWPGTAFTYQLKAVYADGTEEDAGESVSATTPGRLTAVLRAPSPNPFSDRCVFELDLPSSSNSATIGVFDVAGRCVKSLHDAPLTRGRHEFAWDGFDNDGSQCAAGVYFVRCESGELVLRQSAVLLR